jgi:nucleoside-diphosphate-sugar epimerase
MTLTQAAAQWEDINPTHLLISVPPQEGRDHVIHALQGQIKANVSLQWIGYLSTTGVYGDWQGAWVDESTTPRPQTARAQWRLQAEQQWLQLHASTHIFRLAGIYGAERNSLLDLQAGQARRLYKAGQVFSRIHVKDIARVLVASMRLPTPQSIYNVCDDEPAPSHEVTAYAARLLGLPAPVLENVSTAVLSPMATSFYGECKRTSNRKLKQALALRWHYPTYREGLNACLQALVKGKY